MRNSGESFIAAFKAYRQRNFELLVEALQAHQISLSEAHQTAIESVWLRRNPKSALVTLSNVELDAEPEFVQFFHWYLEGILFNRAGRKANAIGCFLKAEKIATKHNATECLVELYLERSTVLAWIGQISAALDDLLLAVALLSELDFPEALQVAWMKLGHLNWERNDYEKSLKFLSLAKNLSGSSLSDDEYAKLQLDIAQNYCELSDFEQADQIRQTIEPDTLQPYTQFLLILLKVRLAAETDSNASMAELEAEALSISDGSEWQRIALSAAIGASVVSHNPRQALEKLKAAEAYFESHHLTSHLWRCFINQIKAYLQLEQFEEAERVLSRAKALATSQNNRRLLETVEALAEKHGIYPSIEMTQPVVISKDYATAKNGYAVIKEIGRGGFGVVYHAFDMVNQREVALKVFDLNNRASQDMANDIELSLKKELTLISKLKHAAIVTPIAFGRHEGNAFYIVSRFVQGNELRAIVKDKSKRNLLVSTLFCVAGALSYAHHKGVVHRDIKPENVLIDSEGDAHLIDFGNALIDAQPQEASGNSGTVRYMSPESFGKAISGPQQDIYALGLTYCEWLLGKHPFEDGIPLNRLQYSFKLSGIKTRLRAALDSVEIVDLLLKMIHFSPSKRPSAKEIVSMLGAS